MQSPRCRQPHPSHSAVGVRWKGGRKVAVMRQEQLGVSSPGSKRPSTRPRGGVQSRAATGRGAGRACCGYSTSTGGAQDSNSNRLHQTRRPVDQFEHVCVEKCPLTTRHIAKTQRRQLRRVATELRRELARRPKRGKPNHDRIRTQTDHLTRMAT